MDKGKISSSIQFVPSWVPSQLQGVPEPTLLTPLNSVAIVPHWAFKLTVSNEKINRKKQVEKSLKSFRLNKFLVFQKLSW